MAKGPTSPGNRSAAKSFNTASGAKKPVKSSPVRTNTSPVLKPRNEPSPGMAPRGSVGTQKPATQQAAPTKTEVAKATAKDRSAAKAQLKKQVRGQAKGPTILSKDFKRSR